MKSLTVYTKQLLPSIGNNPKKTEETLLILADSHGILGIQSVLRSLPIEKVAQHLAEFDSSKVGIANMLIDPKLFAESFRYYPAKWEGTPTVLHAEGLIAFLDGILYTNESEARLSGLFEAIGNTDWGMSALCVIGSLTEDIYLLVRDYYLEQLGHTQFEDDQKGARKIICDLAKHAPDVFESMSLRIFPDLHILELNPDKEDDYPEPVEMERFLYEFKNGISQPLLPKKQEDAFAL